MIRILRLTTMRHRRETTLSFNLKTVDILTLSVICCYITGQRGIFYSIFEFCGWSRWSREGDGKGDKSKKCTYYMITHRSRCRVTNFCACTHRRSYHVNPDLRWHGQKRPYGSLLYIFTEYSTSVDEILTHKLLQTVISVTQRISTYWLLLWRCPHGTTKYCLSCIMQRACFNKWFNIFRFGDATSPQRLNN